MTSPGHLVDIHMMLFAADVKEAKRLAAIEGLPYQTYLRLLVRRSLRGAIRQLKEPRVIE